MTHSPGTSPAQKFPHGTALSQDGTTAAPHGTAPLLTLAYAIEARCVARGEDLTFSPTQAATLQDMRQALDALTAAVAMNEKIFSVLRAHQAELFVAITTRPTAAGYAAWARFVGASEGFTHRLDATRAASDALTARQQAFCQEVLTQLEQEASA